MEKESSKITSYAEMVKDIKISDTTKEVIELLARSYGVFNDIVELNSELYRIDLSETFPDIENGFLMFEKGLMNFMKRVVSDNLYNSDFSKL